MDEQQKTVHIWRVVGGQRCSKLVSGRGGCARSRGKGLGDSIHILVVSRLMKVRADALTHRRSRNCPAFDAFSGTGVGAIR